MGVPILDSISSQQKAQTTDRPPQQPIPSAGRLVYFVLKRPGLPEIRPAIIVKAITHAELNLQVFTDGPNDGGGAEANGIMHLTGVMLDPSGKPGTWHWMPYQLGQAAKNDGDVAQLRDQQNEDRDAIVALQKQVAGQADLITELSTRLGVLTAGAPPQSPSFGVGTDMPPALKSGPTGSGSAPA